YLRRMCEVDRLVEAVRSLQAFRGEAPEVPGGLRRRERGRERGRVGRHDQLVAQAALETQAGDSEGAVLVVVAPVDEVVGALRDSPGDAAVARVLDLAPHAHATALVEDRFRIALHEEQR